MGLNKGALLAAILIAALSISCYAGAVSTKAYNVTDAAKDIGSLANFSAGLKQTSLSDTLNNKGILVFGNLSVFRHLFRNKWQDRRYQEQGCHTKGHRGDRTGEEGEETSFGHEECLSEVKVEHRAQYEGKHQWRPLVAELPEQVPDNAEDDHDHDVKRTVVHTVGTDQAEKQNEWIEELCWNLQHLNPHGNQGKVQYQEHDVPQVHAAYDAPEEVRMILEKKRPRSDTMDQKSPEEHGQAHIWWNPESKKRNEGGRGC